MKKSLAIIIGTILILCFSSVTTYQYNRIKYLENIIEGKDSKFKTIQVKLTNTEKAYQSAMVDNRNLLVKIDKLESKITKYKKVIRQLKTKIRIQDLKIVAISDKLTTAQKSYIATIQELDILRSKPKNILTTADLEQEEILVAKKGELTKEIDEMYIKRNTIKENNTELVEKQEKYENTEIILNKKKEKIATKIEDNDSKVKELEGTSNLASDSTEYKEKQSFINGELIEINELDLKTQTPEEIEKEKQKKAAAAKIFDQGYMKKPINVSKPDIKSYKLKQLNAILQNTWIKYYSVQILKEKSGKPIRRLTKKKNNWNFTKVRFDIFSKVMKDIEGEEFQIQIVDAKTNKALASEEANPMFPDSESGSKGVDFVSNNEKLRLTLSNHQLKKGKNYYILVSYKYDGKYYPIANSKLPIIKNRKSIF